MFKPGAIDYYIHEHTQAAEQETANWRLAQESCAQQEVPPLHNAGRFLIALSVRALRLGRQGYRAIASQPITTDRAIHPKR